MEAPDNSSSSTNSKTKMCAFFASSGCFHGSKCSYAHSAQELQDAADMRKKTVCLNYQRGRCALTTCKFAHGEQGAERTVFGSKDVCAPSKSGGRFTDRKPVMYKDTLVSSAVNDMFVLKSHRTPIFLNLSISSDSIADSTDQQNTSKIEASPERRRLDLFPCIDFSNEESAIDEYSLLTSLTREMMQLPFLDAQVSLTASPAILADGDDSPWSLPH